MKRIFILVFLTLTLIFEHLCAQEQAITFSEDGYRIDKSTFLVANPPFGDFAVTDYIYDEDNRLIRIEYNNYVVEITYDHREETQITTNPQLPSSPLFKRLYDQAGYIQVEMRGTLQENGNLTIMQIDSFYRDQNHQVTLQVQLSNNNGDFVPTEYEYSYYNSQGQLDSLLSTQYSFSGLKFYESHEYFQYDNNLRLTEHATVISGDPGTTKIERFVYDDDFLKERRLQVFNGSILTFEELDHYVMIAGGNRCFSMIATTSNQNFDTLRITDSYHSGNRFLLYDSIHIDYLGKHEFTNYEDYRFAVVENEEKDSLKYIEIHQLNKKGVTTLSGTRKQELYSRKLLEYEIPNPGTILLAPNPANLGQEVLILTKDLEFDEITVHNTEGKIIHQQSITRSNKTYLEAPEIPGLYYVQVYNNNRPTANTARLVVVAN